VLVLVDAQVAPALAPWFARTFAVEAIAVRDLKLRDAEDLTIFADGQRRKPLAPTIEAIHSRTSDELVSLLV
jgi:predicted nuclease of predicted toxin-antitoxin system